MGLAPGRCVRVLISLVCIGILLALIHFAAEVITPFLLGATIAIAFQPLARAIHERGLPTVLAAIVTILVVLATVAGAGAIIYVAASDLSANLPGYHERIEALQIDIASFLDGRDLHGAAASVRRFDVDDAVGDAAASTMFRAGGFLTDLFFVLVITAFIQLEAAMYRRKLIRALGGPRKVHWLDGGLREVQRYLIIQVAVSLANGVLLGTWCAVWGIDSPLLWGVLAFALNFIPIVGSLLAAIPPILLGLVDGGAGVAIAVASGYVVVNLVVDNIIAPRIMGRSLGLSPLVVLLSMIVWAFVLGPVGAILAVPLTMAAKIVFERDEDLRRIAMMMGDGTELAPKPTPASS